MEVLAISSAVRGYHVDKDIWKPSISPVKGSSISALTNLPSKLSTTECFGDDLWKVTDFFPRCFHR